MRFKIALGSRFARLPALSPWRLKKEYACAGALLSEKGLAGADAIVADFKLPDMSAPTLHDELARRGSDLPIIFLAGRDDVSDALRAVHAPNAGIADVPEKPIGEDELLCCLQRKFQSGSDRVQDFAAQEAVSAVARLTPREHAIFVRLIGGATHRDIGRDLGISHRTVEAYRTRILCKTKTRNFCELVRLAVVSGIIA